MIHFCTNIFFRLEYVSDEIFSRLNTVRIKYFRVFYAFPSAASTPSTGHRVGTALRSLDGYGNVTVFRRDAAGPRTRRDRSGRRDNPRGLTYFPTVKRFYTRATVSSCPVRIFVLVRDVFRHSKGRKRDFDFERSITVRADRLRCPSKATSLRRYLFTESSRRFPAEKRRRENVCAKSKETFTCTDNNMFVR